ncbi:MAG: hypothetical protein NT154_01845, partial [Verrucomicrobia bacterium]|nr:hypothetical protein [Verrucomicrobiota bacterium]
MNKQTLLPARALVVAAITICLLLASPGLADTNNANTDWLKAAKYGVFIHFLPGNGTQFALVKDFNVDAVARQLEEVGAKYCVLTLGQ